MLSVVLMQEEKMQQLVLNWNSRTSQLLAPVVSGMNPIIILYTKIFIIYYCLSEGHASTILWMAHSPTSPAFMTCGSDCKMRFFCYKQQ